MRSLCMLLAGAAAAAGSNQTWTKGPARVVGIAELRVRKPFVAAAYKQALGGLESGAGSLPGDLSNFSIAGADPSGLPVIVVDSHIPGEGKWSQRAVDVFYGLSCVCDHIVLVVNSEMVTNVGEGPEVLSLLPRAAAVARWRELGRTVNTGILPSTTIVVAGSGRGMDNGRAVLDEWVEMEDARLVRSVDTLNFPVAQRLDGPDARDAIQRIVRGSLSGAARGISSPAELAARWRTAWSRVERRFTLQVNASLEEYLSPPVLLGLYRHRMELFLRLPVGTLDPGAKADAGALVPMPEPVRPTDLFVQHKGFVLGMQLQESFSAATVNDTLRMVDAVYDVARRGNTRAVRRLVTTKSEEAARVLEKTFWRRFSGRLSASEIEKLLAELSSAASDRLIGQLPPGGECGQLSAMLARADEERRNLTARLEAEALRRVALDVEPALAAAYDRSRDGARSIKLGMPCGLAALRRQQREREDKAVEMFEDQLQSSVFRGPVWTEWSDKVAEMAARLREIVGTDKAREEEANEQQATVAAEKAAKDVADPQLFSKLPATGDHDVLFSKAAAIVADALSRFDGVVGEMKDVPSVRSVRAKLLPWFQNAVCGETNSVFSNNADAILPLLDEGIMADVAAKSLRTPDVDHYVAAVHAVTAWEDASGFELSTHTRHLVVSKWCLKHKDIPCAKPCKPWSKNRFSWARVLDVLALCGPHEWPCSALVPNDTQTAAAPVEGLTMCPLSNSDPCAGYYDRNKYPAWTREIVRVASALAIFLAFCLSCVLPVLYAVKAWEERRRGLR